MSAAVPAYDLAPLLGVLAVGTLIALVPLAWVWRRRHGDAQALRLQAFAWLVLFLCFDLVMLGAFTRLSDSGLGCPDWPGCYGNASPIGASEHIAAAQAAVPTGPVRTLATSPPGLGEVPGQISGIPLIGSRYFGTRHSST